MDQKRDAKTAMKIALAEKCGAQIQRRQVGDLTMMLVTPKTCANRDSAGTGVPGAFKVKGRVCYPTDRFVDWLFEGNQEEG